MARASRVSHRFFFLLFFPRQEKDTTTIQVNTARSLPSERLRQQSTAVVRVERIVADEANHQRYQCYLFSGIPVAPLWAWHRINGSMSFSLFMAPYHLPIILMSMITPEPSLCHPASATATAGRCHSSAIRYETRCRNSVRIAKHYNGHNPSILLEFLLLKPFSL